MLEAKILGEYRTVAIVGASSDPRRPSYRVTRYLVSHGYHVIPVNPHAEEILGMPTYPDLSSVPDTIEVVNVFRNPEEVMPVVDEAIKVGAKAFWMQEGVVNQAVAAKARAAGLLVIMDKCMRKEHIRLSRKHQINKVEH